LLALAAGSLAGCSNSGTAAASHSDAAKPLLTMGLTNYTSTLNPAIAGGGDQSMPIDLAYESLTHLEPDGNIGPGLATSWHYIAAPRRSDRTAWVPDRAVLVRNPVLRVVMRRCVMSVPLLFVVSALTFVLVSLTPGNAAEEILGTSATPAEDAALNHALGLNLPLYEQYWNWLRHALTGHLGQSIFTNQPVTQAIGQRLPVTLSLLVGALIVSVVVGIGLGAFSAVRGRRGRAGRRRARPDRLQPPGLLGRRRADRDLRRLAELVPRDRVRLDLRLTGRVAPLAGPPRRRPLALRDRVDGEADP